MTDERGSLMATPGSGDDGQNKPEVLIWNPSKDTACTDYVALTEKSSWMGLAPSQVPVGSGHWMLHVAC